MRLLFVTDYSEQFAFRLLKGIQQYSQDSGERWVVCRMPSSYMHRKGLKEVVKWAVQWRADVVIGQFKPNDNVGLFRKKGIVAMAQDYITPFEELPNITANYEKMGRMAADRFMARGFKNFAFFGNIGMCRFEPIVEVFEGDSRVTYVHVDPAKAKEIVEKHIVGGQPIVEYTVGAAEK